MLVDVQNALNRAHEIKLSGKRHLGTYFRVIFYGVHHFGFVTNIINLSKQP